MIPVRQYLKQYHQQCPPWALGPCLFGFRGSQAHGTHSETTDDVDLFSVVLKSEPWYLTKAAYNRKDECWDTGGELLDVCAYDARKFLYLLQQGNPNVHIWLWTESCLRLTGAGQWLWEHRSDFLSKRVFTHLMGYSLSQQQKAYKGKQNRADRTVDGSERRLGYDFKNATHCVQLLIWGIHLAKTDTLKVKFEGSDLDLVMALKRGQKTLAEVETISNDLAATFRAAEAQSSLPDEVPDGVVDCMFHDMLDS